MRNLASVQHIAEVRPIEGADAIEHFRVNGWWVVDKKGAYGPGDAVCYLEVDSWVPHELAPFLTKNAATPRVYNGVSGERLRTVKLRGALSQGLLLPLIKVTDAGIPLHEGVDLTEHLGIQKWEAPIPAQLEGIAKGNFPTSLMPKTDQDRIQNCFKRLKHTDHTYEVSLKLDGSSMTVFRLDGQLRVCSRNMELLINDENAGNSFVKTALELGDKILEGVAFQGELMGPGIQKNREQLKTHQFFVFDVFNITAQKRLLPDERRSLCDTLELNHVPILHQAMTLPDSVADCLSMAEGPSINHKIREGLVWKSNTDSSISFKAISNRYLLKSEA